MDETAAGGEMTSWVVWVMGIRGVRYDEISRSRVVLEILMYIILSLRVGIPFAGFLVRGGRGGV